MDLTDYPQFQQLEALGMQEWPPLPQILFAHILIRDGLISPGLTKLFTFFRGPISKPSLK